MAGSLPGPSCSARDSHVWGKKAKALNDTQGLFISPVELNFYLLQLILCSDLENDFINPHDASNKLNAWVVCPLEAWKSQALQYYV